MLDMLDRLITDNFVVLDSWKMLSDNNYKRAEYDGKY